MTLTDIANHAEEIRALKAERDELAAQVEYLKSHFNELIEIAQRCDSWESFPQKPLDRALAALRSLPQQCLREIEAKAGRAGYLKGADDWNSFEQVFVSDIRDSADKYAATLRQGGAE